MKWCRIWGIVLRHLIQLPTDFNKFFSIIYWPFLDILIFGFTGSGSCADSGGSIENQFALLTGVVLWQIIPHSSYCFSVNLLEEIWSHNLTNIFSTPLTIGEWIVATIIEGVIMLSAIMSFCSVLTYLIYRYNIFNLGLCFIPIVFLTFLSSIAIGLLGCSLIIFWGTRVQSMAWMIGWVFAPVSGAFYPIEVLPQWLQVFAQAFPLHYIFGSMRIMLETGICPLTMLLKGLELTILYLVLTLSLFIIMYNKSRQQGLARIID